MILTLCPTRGRPAQAAEVHRSFLATIQGADTGLLFVVDEDDPSKFSYLEMDLPVMEVEGGSMAAALNQAAMFASQTQMATILGFIGDDHRFRSKGWDQVIEQHLTEFPGFAYGDDKLQGANLPTHVFVNETIIRALGWFALPGCRHLYLDNTWKELGEAADCLTYFPGITVEHMHPAAGKAKWDANYERVNSQAVYAADGAVFEAWRSSDQFQRDVDAVRRAAASSTPV